jgi:16S rRNA (cytosine1402-N4)-methyltransferase
MVYVDVTFGGGGHSKEILSRLGPNGNCLLLIRMSALANVLTDERFTLINENFRFIKRFLRFTVEKCGWDFGGFGSFLSSI